MPTFVPGQPLISSLALSLLTCLGLHSLISKNTIPGSHDGELRGWRLAFLSPASPKGFRAAFLPFPGQCFLLWKKVTVTLDRRIKLTVGKVSSGIGAAAEVLVNLYMNDHRPKAQASSPDLETTRKAFPLNLGGSDTCYFCKKRVYVMERLSAEGHFFHRECFRCSVCATTLRLAAYAFDGDEGKFFCKPHFIHCKANSQQRKRRADLKQQREEEGLWPEHEAPRQEPPTESSCAAAALGSPTGSPPVPFSLPVLHPLLG